MIATTLEVGTELPGFTRSFTRATLVAYAGASGDLNPIHWSDRAAASLGLDTVIAHGMLTMGTALRVVTDWCGDPARVLSYYVRFTKPVPVPDDDAGVDVVFGGRIAAVADGVATVVLDVVCGGVAVLGQATCEVRVD